MFTAFDEVGFLKAVKEKDYDRLKSDTISSMLDDPTFARGETDKVLQILEKNVPEVFEDEIRLDYEERLDPNAWDKRYFTKLTYWFQENFAKSRVPYIKEVGKVVHKDTAEQYEASLKISQAAISTKRTVTQTKSSSLPKTTATTQQNRKIQNPTQAPAVKAHKFSVVGVIGAAAVLVLVVMLLIKLLGQ